MIRLLPILWIFCFSFLGGVFAAEASREDLFLQAGMCVLI
jgi:hypothetical protein